MNRPALLRDRTVEIGLGIAAFLTAIWLLDDAYEGRGHQRPFLARRLLP